MPLFLLSFLKNNWLTVGMGVIIAVLMLDVAWKGHRIKSLDVEVGALKLNIQMAQLAYDAQVLKVEEINKANIAEVKTIQSDYTAKLNKTRTTYADAYAHVIATIPAGGLRPSAPSSTGNSAVSGNVSSSSGTDASPKGTVTLGDAIDCALQVEGLQNYVTSQYTVLK